LHWHTRLKKRTLKTKAGQRQALYQFCKTPTFPAGSLPLLYWLLFSRTNEQCDPQQARNPIKRRKTAQYSIFYNPAAVKWLSKFKDILKVNVTVAIGRAAEDRGRNAAGALLVMGQLCHRAEFCYLEIESMTAGEKTPLASPAIRMGRNRGLFTLDTTLILPRPLHVVFPFFADAGNLEMITPPWLQFHILTPLPINMHTGTRIDYRLRLYGVTFRWQTEITAWEPPLRFVDEQRHGPYRKWIHEHTFKECVGGTEMRDFVQYDTPGGWLVHLLFVQRNVRQIFAYRARKLRPLFA
jgi:ligand-binding SRPBCC domain-containing protein